MSALRGPRLGESFVEFPTLDFVAFGLLTLSLSWALAGYRTAQKLFLLTLSYVFAAKWHFGFLAILVGSSLVNYGVGWALHRMPEGAKRRALFWLGIALNLGVLGFFKYYGFFTDNLNNLASFLGLEAHLPILELLAPFGISFYTFQGMAYVTDTYRNKAVQPSSLLDFLLFISFFPQFGAGPICRSDQLLPQLAAPAPARIEKLSEAVVLILSGLFKKMVLATYLANHLTTDAFLAPSGWSSLELNLAIFAYTAQVYLDFSGYTDIARGVGLLFGFELPENFRYPYAATNIGEYWRRWHITFSSWLREYIYFPLGGSRKGRMRTYLNLMITFVACGIWHGPNWGFIIWGGLHGIGLSLYKASLDLRRDRGIDTKAPKPFYWLVGGWALTLAFSAYARIFFKTSDLDTAFEMIGRLVTGPLLGNGFDLGVLFLTLLTLWMNFFGRRVFDGLVHAHERIPMPLQPVSWVLGMLLLFTLKPYGMAATIYFQF